MKRLTPKKEIREKIIFSNDEQTQKVCQFAGDIEDIFEIMEKMHTSRFFWKDDDGSIYEEDYTFDDYYILYNPKENSIEIYRYTFIDGWKMSEYGTVWWLEGDK